jgi:hypothetical protein
MVPAAFRREFPVPSLSVFFILQVLDILTTLIGLSMGAREASVFVGRLLSLGPVAGLLIPKLFATLLVVSALRFGRARLIVFLNYWFAAVVTWNLVMIVSGLYGWL